MNKWQPIETAPKDGTRILGYGDGWISIAIYHEYMELFITDDSDENEPTHWMPLPETPEVEP